MISEKGVVNKTNINKSTKIKKYLKKSFEMCPTLDVPVAIDQTGKLTKVIFYKG